MDILNQTKRQVQFLPFIFILIPACVIPQVEKPFKGLGPGIPKKPVKIPHPD